jgi:predicted N-formylglutamate amidohydrolase
VNDKEPAVDTFRILNPHSTSTLLLTCEHASNAIPAKYDGLGLPLVQIADHIGWDIGAADLTARLGAHLGSLAVLAGISRLVIDCNRSPTDHDLIVTRSAGVRIPGNEEVGQNERAFRIREYYAPYHGAIDAVIADRKPSFLLSIHSFTPKWNGRERCYDAGVLFDSYENDAERLGVALAGLGLAVRYNEPYSGFDGLIFSAADHGGRHGIRYLELEVNNLLLRDEGSTESVANCVSNALRNAKLLSIAG